MVKSIKKNLTPLRMHALAIRGKYLELMEVLPMKEQMDVQR